MGDVMMFGIAQMPYEMAMGDELSRLQFYTNTQRLVAEHEALLRRVADAPVGVAEATRFEFAPEQFHEGATVEVPAELAGRRVRILAEPGEVGS